MVVAGVSVVSLVSVGLVPEGTSGFSWCVLALCVFMGVLVTGSLEIGGFRREEIRFPSSVYSDICGHDGGYCFVASN